MVNTKSLKVIALSFLLLTLYSCDKVKGKDVYGTYIAEYDLAKETLIINSDGTFSQEVLLKSNSKRDIRKGSWTYNEEMGYITFHENFVRVLNAFRDFNPNYLSPQKGLELLPIENFFGQIRLGSDEEVLYKKSQ